MGLAERGNGWVFWEGSRVENWELGGKERGCIHSSETDDVFDLENVNGLGSRRRSRVTYSSYRICLDSCDGSGDF